MRFVPIKNREQLAVLALHRARQGFVKAKTAQANQIRGLLAEQGLIIPKGIAHISQRLPEILEESENGLPGAFRQLLERLPGSAVAEVILLLHAVNAEHGVEWIRATTVARFGVDRFDNTEHSGPWEQSVHKGQNISLRRLLLNSLPVKVSW